jgi:hypothetical protein
VAATAGKDAALYVNGYDLSTQFRQGAVTGTADVEDSTTWGSDSHTYVETLLDSSGAFSGFFAGGAGSVDEVLEAALDSATAPVACWFPAGDTAVGDRGYGIVASETAYEISDEVEGLAAVTSELQGNGWYPVVSLAPKATRSSTYTGAAHDGGAASSNGGMAFLEVFSVSASDTIDGVIQDSADGVSGWATIATFSQVTDANDPQAQAVAISGTIRRYTRAVLTLAGGSISIVAAAALHRTP